jgi:hypothetical protein
MSKKIIGIVMIAVCMIVFPIILTGAHTILIDANIADYTGLQTLVAISPMLIFLAFLITGGILTFQGFKGSSGGGGKRHKAKGLH